MNLLKLPAMLSAIYLLLIQLEHRTLLSSIKTTTLILQPMMLTNPHYLTKLEEYVKTLHVSVKICIRNKIMKTLTMTFWYNFLYYGIQRKFRNHQICLVRFQRRTVSWVVQKTLCRQKNLWVETYADEWSAAKNESN